MAFFLASVPSDYNGILSQSFTTERSLHIVGKNQSLACLFVRLSAIPKGSVYDLKRTYQKSVKLKTSSDADYLADPSMIKKSVETEEEYNTVTDDTPNGESSSEDPLQQAPQQNFSFPVPWQVLQ